MVNGLYSPWRPVTTGVMQRPIPGPVLFSIIISDLEGMTQCTPRKFADDTNLGGPVAVLEGRTAFWSSPDRRGPSWNSTRTKAKSCLWERRPPDINTGWGKTVWGATLVGKVFREPCRTVSSMLDSSVAWQQRWPTASRTASTGPQAAHQRRGLSPYSALIRPHLEPCN